MLVFLLLCGVPPMQAITFAATFYALAILLFLEGRS